MKLYFTGSDVLLLNQFPPGLRKIKYPYVLLMRLWVRLSKHFIEEYWCVDDHLIPEMREFGIKREIKIFHHPVEHNIKYPKVKHNTFNILYYCPSGNDKLNKWIYGYDVFTHIRNYYKYVHEVRFLRSWGQYNMEETYPITDFYIRCNRHDGDARMVRECEIQGIPYYWTYENPDASAAIRMIEDARRGKHINR